MLQSCSVPRHRTTNEQDERARICQSPHSIGTVRVHVHRLVPPSGPAQTTSGNVDQDKSGQTRRQVCLTGSTNNDAVNGAWMAHYKPTWAAPATDDDDTKKATTNMPCENGVTTRRDILRRRQANSRGRLWLVDQDVVEHLHPQPTIGP
jgi:hypothetical protein